MNRELKREKLNIDNLEVVSGGVAVDVFSEALCCKPSGSFKILESKETQWKQEGCPEKCKYCWNLKFNDGFFCNV